jgi:hypothetical protein
MKKYITIVILGLVISSTACAQTWNEWFKQKKTQKKYLIQQIAALKVYLKTAKKGYDIAQQGLTIIGDIKDGSFQMDKTYFASLKDVNPSIRNSSKVRDILAYQKKIMDDLSGLNAWSSRDVNFTAEELQELSLVQKNLLHKSNDSLDELTLVITPASTEMKDDERWQRIDRIYTEMQQRYVFVQALSNQARSLSLTRSKDLHEINALRAGYQLI